MIRTKEENAMRRNKLFLVLGCFLCLLLPHHAIAQENIGTNFNLSILHVGGRISKESYPRTEMILDLPFPLQRQADEHSTSGFMGLLYLDSLTFSNEDNKFNVSAIGGGRIYYFSKDATTSDMVFIPYLTIFRQLLMMYRLEPDDETIKRTQWLVPGLQFSARLTERSGFHSMAELYSYTQPENHRIKTGFSYLLHPRFSLSAVVERQAWNVSDGAKNKQVRGYSDAYYLKGILRFSGWYLATSIGYEQLQNSGKPALLEVGDIKSGGMMIQAEIGGGIMTW